MNELIQMGVDLYFNRVNLDKYSREEAEEAFRKALLDLCGGDLSFKSFRRNQVQVFELIEQMLDLIIPQALANQIEDFAEVKNTKWGDNLKFEVPDNTLFEVAKIASGTLALRSERIYNDYIVLQTAPFGVKIRAELYDFLAGKINWQKMIDRVALSFTNKIRQTIYDAVVNSYNTLNAPYKYQGAFDEVQHITIAQHIEAATGSPVTVFGTKLALSKILPSNAFYLSEEMKNKLNTTGYLGNYRGIEMIELKQAHKPNTDEFAIDNNTLIYVPNGGDKIVKVGFEGDAVIQEIDNPADMSKEYTLIKYFGVAVITTSKYGIYKLA